MAKLKRKPADLPDEQEELLSELEEDESPESGAAGVGIPKKHDSREGQIFIQRNDFLIPNILEMVKKRRVLDISPTYQRRARWNDTKRSHLIESLLMNVPIPPIFLFERALARYEVMDGQQRLGAIRSFFENEFELQDLKVWTELNGNRFKDLPPDIQSGLMRRGLAAVIILTESGQDESAALRLRQYVFERLNTGGVSLNAQEVRNCIYASPFNDMLVEIARAPLFTSIWGIPPKERHEPQKVSRLLTGNRLYATMSDCEIVLRYFALQNLDTFRGMKGTLDDCMRDKRSANKEQCRGWSKEYLEVLETAKKIFGSSLFRLPSRRGEMSGRRSIPLADATLLGLKASRQSWSKLIARRDDVIQRTKAALKREKTYEALVGRGNTKVAIDQRIRIMRKVLQRVAQG